MAKTIARTRAPKDTSPVWEGCESWDADKFSKHYYMAMEYYRLEYSGKDLKPAILKWMASVGCAKEDITALKNTKDN